MTEQKIDGTLSGKLEEIVIPELSDNGFLNVVYGPFRFKPYFTF